MSLLLDALKKAEQDKAAGDNTPGKLELEPAEEDKTSVSAEHSATDETPPRDFSGFSTTSYDQNSPFADINSALLQAKRKRQWFFGAAIAVITLLLVSGWSVYWWNLDQQFSTRVVPIELPAYTKPPAREFIAPKATAVEKQTIIQTPVKQPLLSEPSSPPTAPSARKIPKTVKQPIRSNTIRFSRNQTQAKISALLNSAYANYRSGSYQDAYEQYQQVLMLDPNNRDALLGLAAIAARREQYEQAQQYYMAILQKDPADSVAKSGLVHILGRMNPETAESQLKSLIAQDQRAPHLYFYLGTVYANQQRWADARYAYSRAVDLDRFNAEYRYNLAVSLDQLGQYADALNQYKQSLQQSSRGSLNFIPQGVHNRIKQLEQYVERKDE